jgi:hypothetical protein
LATNDEPQFPAPVKGELPVKGTRLYRGTGGDESKGAGIHWTLKRSQAEHFANLNHNQYPVMEIEVDDPEGQVIPRLSLEPRNYDDVGIMSNKNILYNEQEYHLRPGANVKVLNRDQLGGHFPERLKIEPKASGVAYRNLSSFAATPLAGAKVSQNLADRFGETQGALFDEVVDKEGKTVKYITSSDIDFEKNMSEFLDNYQDGNSTRFMDVYTPPKTEDK